LHHLGTVQERLGKFKEALGTFNLALKYDCNFAAAYNGRGLVWDRLGNSDQALIDFSTSIELDKSNPVY
jgi:Flp pilus assembly protein TadD, contains TPR repeats